MRWKQRISILAVLGCYMFSMPLAMCKAQSPDELVVPANMIFKLELLSGISTATNKKGDEFTCKVISPPEFANAYVNGRIVKVKPSGKVSGNSEMGLAFDRITMPDERWGGFSGEVKEVYEVAGAADQGRADTEGTVSGRSMRKRDALKIGRNVAIGTLLGALLGGRNGAIIGGAIAAGLSVTNTLATKGPDLAFKEGTQFSVQTEKSFIVKRRNK